MSSKTDKWKGEEPLSKIENCLIHFVNPLCTNCYKDDNFVVFDNERECDLFLEQLNVLHPSLQFTFEKECNQPLPFLNVMVEKASQNSSPLSTENLFSLANTLFGILLTLKNGKLT